MIRVYIASPYTIGNVLENVTAQIKVAHELMNLGFAPYLPLLCHFQHTLAPRPYEDWMKQDLEWLTACDVLLRLPGESKGADQEVKFAQEKGIPVRYSLEELKISLVEL